MQKIILVDGVENSGKSRVCKCINSILKDNNVINTRFNKPIYSDKTSLETAFAVAHYYINTMERLCDVVSYSYKENTFCIMDGSFVSDYVYSYLYRNVAEQHAQLTQNMIKDAIQNEMYKLNPNVNNMLDLLRENFLYIQCECPSAFSNKEDIEKVKEEKKRFDIIYNGQSVNIQNVNIDWMTKYKIETVYWKSDGTCDWKTNEQLYNELKEIVNLRQ